MKSIDLSELSEWKEKGVKFQLIDVREDEEREIFHIGGLHIPLSEIAGSISRIPNDMPLVLYCRKGVRSRIAIQRLIAAEPSYEANLYNLSGGIGDGP